MCGCFGPFRAKSTQVEDIDSLEQLVALRDEWSELWDCDPTATVFQHPDWLLPWTRHLSAATEELATWM